jgi:hypothetical protein
MCSSLGQWRWNLSGTRAIRARNSACGNEKAGHIFHTHCELKAEFFYTVAEWQFGVFRIEGRCTDFRAGPR